MRICIFLIVAWGVIASRAFAGYCRFTAKPTIIERTDAALQYWDLPTDELLRISAAPDAAALRTYRHAVKSKLSTAPADLLRRYRTRGKDLADIHNLETVL